MTMIFFQRHSFFKPLIGLSLLLFATVSSAKNAAYYSMHPEALQQVMTQCSAQNEASERCEELRQIAIRLNNLAYSLRMNPLEYGQQIIALQTMIAQQVQDHQISTLALSQQNLREHLAVIKWLESPGS